MAKGRAVAIVLNEAEKQALAALTRKHGAPQSVAVRARIVVAAASGLTNQAIAAKFDVCAHTAGVWRKRFASDGMDGRTTSRVRARHARSVTTRSPPPSARRSRHVPEVRRTGACGLWRRR